MSFFIFYFFVKKIKQTAGFKHWPHQNSDKNSHLLSSFNFSALKSKKQIREKVKRNFIVDTGDDLSNLNMEKLEKYIAGSMDVKRPFKTIMAQMNVLNQWNNIPFLGELNAKSVEFGFPVVVMHGDRDLILNVNNGVFLHEKMKDSKFYLMKGEGHLVHLSERGLVQSVDIIAKTVNDKQNNSLSKL